MMVVSTWDWSVPFIKETTAVTGTLLPIRAGVLHLSPAISASGFRSLPWEPYSPVAVSRSGAILAIQILHAVAVTLVYRGFPRCGNNPVSSPFSQSQSFTE